MFCAFRQETPRKAISVKPAAHFSAILGSRWLAGWAGWLGWLAGPPPQRPLQVSGVPEYQGFALEKMHYFNSSPPIHAQTVHLA